MFKKQLISILTLVIFLSFSISSLAASKEKSMLNLSTENPIAVGMKDIKADSATAKNNGKVVIIDLNRTNFNNFNNIKFLREKLEQYGDVGLMNIRGDKGYDDRRNYASMGATGRVNISNDEVLDFAVKNSDNSVVYKSTTGYNPLGINLININNIDFYNKSKGEFKSEMGYLGDILESANKKVAVLGNSDYYDSDGKYVKDRDFCLMVMDSKGRIPVGNIDSINMKNLSYPYGISTDYAKLKEETKKYYKDSNLLFVNLGDTYRLDKFKPNYNEKTYKKAKFRIYNNISDYLKFVFSLIDKNDTVYILGSFPSDLDYKNNRRLGAVVRFDFANHSKGLLESSTTRRKGVISNIDIGVDILNRFGFKNQEMVGRVLKSKAYNDRLEFIGKEYEKIVAISSIRMTIINIYVVFISLSWAVAALALWQRNRLPKKSKKIILKTLKELVKFGLIMPLAFLSAPIFGTNTEAQVALSIVFISIFYYLISIKLFKGDDLKQLGFFAVMMILLITVDSVISTPLMKSNIMSYDSMIGARYYGIGNEYEGVTIGSAILGFAILLEYKKIKKWMAALLLIIILFTSAYPGMGANVGGAISECIAYLTFILLIYDVKIDLKKSAIIILATFLLVVAFAAADILLGTGSHLGNFVEQIKLNGPMEIIYVFARKIDMNLQLAQTTIWVNILLVGLVILALCIIKPNKSFKGITENKFIYKGFISTMVGCFVTLLVNDSGIISSATDSLYLFIPILIIMMNKRVNTEYEELIC